MNQEQGSSSRSIWIIYRVLLTLALILALMLFGGTIYALVFRASGPSPAKGLPARQRDAGGQPSPANEKLFSGLGRLRISLTDSAMLIFSPVFPYNPADIAFTEELAQRIRLMREISVEYFSPFNAAELQNMNEDALKAELLRRFNKALRLGSIGVIYFNDFIIIE